MFVRPSIRSLPLGHPARCEAQLAGWSSDLASWASGLAGGPQAWLVGLRPGRIAHGGTNKGTKEQTNKRNEQTIGRTNG